jgi:hypothetical protein
MQTVAFLCRLKENIYVKGDLETNTILSVERKAQVEMCTKILHPTKMCRDTLCATRARSFRLAP